MNRETQAHFSQVPATQIQRSSFKRPTKHLTTLNEGDLVPLFWDEILASDTVENKTSMILRMSTPMYPVMDDCVMDTYWFFTPFRLLWDHYKNFMGEKEGTFWEEETEYEMPQIKAPEGGWEKGTIADYLGVPTGVENFEITAMPFRAYSMIYNEWFRSEQLKQPIMINYDETTRTGSNGKNYITDCQLGGYPAKAAKTFDYFTSCTPKPQEGPSITLPLGTTAPIMGNGMAIGLTDGVSDAALVHRGPSNYNIGTSMSQFGHDVRETAAASGNLGSYTLGLTKEGEKSGMVADLSLATAATISELRQAFAVQRMAEKTMLYGNRLTETLRAHFGVVSPDARLQRPEYLGGERVQISMSQVVQTSATDETSPQGNTAAFSLTQNTGGHWIKSFTEPGVLMCVGVIRVNNHSYQQGLEAKWTRKTKLQFYWPSLAHLSNQPVLNKEIYLTGTDADNEVFGYQEAYASYRYSSPSRVSGAFRSNYAQSLDSWHYADYYEEQPILGSTWIDEPRSNINRVIAVQDELEDQFIGDFYFDQKWVRPMPMFSVPGMIDHY